MSGSVGIRKLQQHASAVIQRVKDGEVIEITERGRPVAQIGPPTRSRIEALIDAGLATPATLSFRDLPPPLPPDGRPLGEELAEMREHER
ncbi:type II toxin-antitoxin system prevent-host-death family antitoxin [Iamia sp.]|uniref:type II toxin-antitoxin system Phd/YefM family antitoxin n=1 Tax=Iamia sp. TaxID=2722710 RepID=UPI002BE113C8|nr:type II toxin-antitoxin system prevent-host-death family antitoxin [Iamia sp.]HXH57446.1 type II toxin-antitoxin system prevent-host-death family antitoxin [Iamia sp.]